MASICERAEAAINLIYRKRNATYNHALQMDMSSRVNDEAYLWDTILSEFCSIANPNCQKVVSIVNPNDKYKFGTFSQLRNYACQKESKDEVKRLCHGLSELQDPMPVDAYITAIVGKPRLSDETIPVDAIYIHCLVVVGTIIAQLHNSTSADAKVRGIRIDDYVRAQMDIPERLRLVHFDDTPRASTRDFMHLATEMRRGDKKYLVGLIKFAKAVMKTDISPPLEAKKAETGEKANEAKQVAISSFKTPALFLAYNYNRVAIDNICKVHSIKCLKSMTKATLVAAIVAKLGDDARDPIKLFTPPVLATATVTP